MYIYHSFFIHSSIEGHPGRLYNMAIVNWAANSVVAVSLAYADFKSFGCRPRSGIAGSNGRSIKSFLRNLHTAFQSGCTNLQPHQQCMSVPFSPHPLQHLLLLGFLIIVILIGWNGILVEFWFAFLLLLKMVNIFSYVRWLFADLLLWSVCSYP